MRSKYLVVVLMASFIFGAAPVEAKKKRRVLVYSGKLMDERGGPVGGVFPLTFAFYGKPRGGAMLWSEQHYVAVDNGAYVVELGRKKFIPKKVRIDQLYVGVRISKGPELVRERFVAEGQSNEEIIRHAAPDKKASRRGGPSGGVVDYAEKSGFSYVSEKADNAVRLDGLTLEQLKKALGSRGGGGKVTLGTNTHNGPPAGGEGGTPFTQLCPEGYVMTGIRGGSGLYIDRVSIICSPLTNSKK